METIHIQRDEQLPGLVTITLNRPDKLNAISFQMHQELQAACRDLSDDPTARVVILTGEGRAFSAGADLGRRWVIAVPRTNDGRSCGLGGAAAHDRRSLPPPSAAPWSSPASISASPRSPPVLHPRSRPRYPDDLALAAASCAARPSPHREQAMTCDRFTAEDARA
jgi:hypothetical protein